MKKEFFLSIAVFFLLNACSRKGEDSIYILPSNYTGSVIILFNQSDGETEKYLNGNRIFNIPPSGILKTKFKAEYRKTLIPKFYYDVISKESELPAIIDWKDFDNGIVSASLPSIGKGYKKLDGSEFVEYEAFFIGTKEQIEKYSEEFNEANILNLIEK
jgi:hypothetical protein